MPHIAYSHFLNSEYEYSIRTTQELLGHRAVSKTMIFTHMLSNRDGLGVQYAQRRRYYE